MRGRNVPIKRLQIPQRTLVQNQVDLEKGKVPDNFLRACMVMPSLSQSQSLGCDGMSGVFLEQITATAVGEE
jgi:hypothetical protein